MNFNQSKTRKNKDPIIREEKSAKKFKRIMALAIAVISVAALVLPAIALDNKNEVIDEAQTETKQEWEKSFENVKLSGKTGKDLLEIAKTQLGYKEKTVKSTADEAEFTYTRYGDWFGSFSEDWNSVFVGFCLNYSNNKDYPFDENLIKWADKLNKKNLFYGSKAIVPEAGDIIFIKNTDDTFASETGIVSDVKYKEGSKELASVSAITARAKSGVEYVDYTFDSNVIVGYGLSTEHKEKILSGKQIVSDVTDTDVRVSLTLDKQEGNNSLILDAQEVLKKEYTDSINQDIEKIKSGDVFKKMSNPQIRVFDIALESSGVDAALTGSSELAFYGISGFKDCAVYAGEDGTVKYLKSTFTEGTSEIKFNTEGLGLFYILTDSDSNPEKTEQKASQETTRASVAKRAAKAVESVGASDTASLTVTKQWSDGQDKHNNDSVTLNLLKNGMPTGTVATVNRDNNWTYTFDNLQKSASGEEFNYSVVESEVKVGYIANYSEIQKVESSDSREVWVPANTSTFTDGKEYLFVSNGFALTKKNYDYSSQAVNKLGSINISGTNYSNHIVGVSDLSKWKATKIEDKMAMQCDGAYIRVSSTLSPYAENAANVVLRNNKLIVTEFNYEYKFLIDNSGIVEFNTSNEGSQFELYEKKNVTVSDDSYYQTITNIKKSDTSGENQTDLILSKTIDYLGDGVNNDDTSLRGDNLYRLYLEAKGYTIPSDLLIIADASTSMGEPDMGDGLKRIAVEDLLINGTMIDGSDPNNKNDRPRAERAKDGLIARFLGSNNENLVALTAFCGGLKNLGEPHEDLKDRFNPINLNWSTLAEMPNGGATGRDMYTDCSIAENNTGTNYHAAFMRASELLEDPMVKNNGHKKHVIFLTDGLPNLSVDDNGNLQSAGSTSRTKQAATELKNNYPDVSFSIIGVSSEATTGSAYKLLTDLSEIWSCPYYLANDYEAFKRAIEESLQGASNVSIVDELSQYVDYYEQQPDILVTATDEFGVQKTVWRGDNETTDNYTADGTKIVDSVGFVPGGQTGKGKIQLILNPEFKLNGNYKFTISFNVKSSIEAEREYVDNSRNYPHTGDENTDYKTNNTSSNKPGFFSNKNAYAEFDVSGSDYMKKYPHPVVQVTPVELNIKVKKVDDYNESPLEGAKFDLYRVATVYDDDFVPIPGSDNVMGVKVNSSALVSGSGGMININKLLRGNYVLVETEAPKGYNPLDGVITFTLNEGGLTQSVGAEINSANQQLTVKNETYYELPNTGGSGNYVYVILGVLSILGALIIYLKMVRGGFKF